MGRIRKQRVDERLEILTVRVAFVCRLPRRGSRRGGRLGDPFGNQWMLAARIETITPAELAAREPA